MFTIQHDIAYAPLPFIVLLVLDTPEVPDSLTGSTLGFLAAEPLSSSCLASVE